MHLKHEPSSEPLHISMADLLGIGFDARQLRFKPLHLPPPAAASSPAIFELLEGQVGAGFLLSQLFLESRLPLFHVRLSEGDGTCKTVKATYKTVKATHKTVKAIYKTVKATYKTVKARWAFSSASCSSNRAFRSSTYACPKEMAHIRQSRPEHGTYKTVKVTYKTVKATYKTVKARWAFYSASCTLNRAFRSSTYACAAVPRRARI